MDGVEEGAPAVAEEGGGFLPFFLPCFLDEEGAEGGAAEDNRGERGLLPRVVGVVVVVGDRVVGGETTLVDAFAVAPLAATTTTGGGGGAGV